MADFEYVRATDLDHAWLNFELDLLLEPRPDGRPNPFYVERPDNPAAQLERQLLRPYRQPPKYFFSGHPGCGKSTELRRLRVDFGICAKYWPINVTIRDEADIYGSRLQGCAARDRWSAVSHLSRNRWSPP
jgi:hypothetical protein